MLQLSWDEVYQKQGCSQPAKNQNIPQSSTSCVSDGLARTLLRKTLSTLYFNNSHVQAFSAQPEFIKTFIQNTEW